MCCNHCKDAGTLFNHRVAKKELRKFRKSGSRNTTRWLIDAIKENGVDGMSLLDIGGGVGMIQHDLMDAGVASVTGVDASSAYLETAKEAHAEQKRDHQVTMHLGDFVDLSDEIEPSDIVTLDRVICCYPDMNALVNASSAHAKKWFALVYPRVKWWTKIGFAFLNTYLVIRKSSFRVFLHPEEKVEQLLDQAGFERRFQRFAILWQVAVFERV